MTPSGPLFPSPPCPRISRATFSRSPSSSSTMIKRTAAVSGDPPGARRPSSRADWRSELLARLGRDPDYRAAYEFLAEESKKLEGEDRQTAVLILPFLAEKLGDKALERDLAADYFETYRDNDPDFGFLDEYTLRDFIPFWATWKRIYPLVYDVNLLSYARTPATGLPGSVDVGLELLNDAFYRISLGPYILEGGYWPKGFHILTIPLPGPLRPVRHLRVRPRPQGRRRRLPESHPGPRRHRRPGRGLVGPASAERRPRPEPGTRAQARPGGRDLALRRQQARPEEPQDRRRGRPLSLSPGRPVDARAEALHAGRRRTIPWPTASTSSTPWPWPTRPSRSWCPRSRRRRPRPSYQKVSSLSFAYSRTAAGGPSVSARASISLPPSRAVILKE
ncbi:MAG: hypothetical protein MZU95_01950 [Desulfomicrobium escambiense]|nr:hypothetical protein [Desulfomicrobium escambiense]